MTVLVIVRRPEKLQPVSDTVLCRSDTIDHPWADTVTPWGFSVNLESLPCTIIILIHPLHDCDVPGGDVANEVASLEVTNLHHRAFMR